MFYNQVTYASGSEPIGVAAADVNSDGRPDIVVKNSGANNASVVLHAGNGTFPFRSYDPAGSNPLYIAAVGDLDDNNDPDIAVPNSGSNTTDIHFDAGNGTFLPQTTYSTGSNPHTVTVADLNSGTLTPSIRLHR